MLEYFRVPNRILTSKFHIHQEERETSDACEPARHVFTAHVVAK